MPETRLIISGPAGQTREELLDTLGTTIGRGTNCDVVLNHEGVSRTHARIYQDPFARWVVEDLGSHNGVLVDGNRIKAHAVSPGQKITIASFTLLLAQPIARKKTDRKPAAHHTISVVDKGLEEEVIAYQTDRRALLSAALIRRLNELTVCLLELAGPAELYNQACENLGKMLDTQVTIVRLPPDDEPLPTAPDVLACHLGKDDPGTEDRQTAGLHFSKRILEAVRAEKRPVMARSGPSSAGHMVLTVVDNSSPNIVYSAPISEDSGTVDALYIDILENKSPNGMFDFIEAAAKQITLARRSLLFADAKAERRMLDQQLALARDLQGRLMPKAVEDRFEVDMSICYEPAMWVGGDYCDIWSLPSGQIAFVVGDVSGKGLGAAMVMTNLQAALRTTMTFCSELGEAAEHVNRHLCQNLRDDMFVTLFLGLFDPLENKLSYVNAGHVQPMVMLPGQEARPLVGEVNIPLGIFDQPIKVVVETLPLGSSLVVVTDGITEAPSPDGNRFEVEGLAKTITESGADSARELVSAITKKVVDYRQTMAQQDDITIFVLINSKTDKNS
jgi:phosphoserine phosphatase RsbU/P